MANEVSQVKRRWRMGAGERQAILFFGDLLVTVFALLLGLYFWAQKDWLNFSWEFLGQRAPFWFYLLPLVWILLLLDTYDIRKANRRSEVIRGVGTAAFIGIIAYLLVFFLAEPNSLPRRGMFFFIIGATLFTIAWRFLYIKIFTAPEFLRRVLIIGAGNAGTTLAEMLQKLHPMPFILVGFIDDDLEKQGKEFHAYPVIGGGKDLKHLIAELDITDLIFAISGELNPVLFREILEAEEKGIQVSSLPNVYEELFRRVPILLLQSDWILRSFIDQSHTSGIYESAKRLMDILGSLLGIIVMIVLYPIIALTILIDSGKPVIFSQIRVGVNGRPFKIIKFRTMLQEEDTDGYSRPTVHNDKRVTRVGNLFRKTHIDELPQFLSILSGESSLVGPRPEQIELVNHYQKKIPFYRARLFVRPGLTGWAQVNQGYASTVEDTVVKLEYDLYYIKHRNLMLDFLIIWRTVGAVLGFRGL